MPPKHLIQTSTDYTDSQADLIRARETIRFQWHVDNPKVTVLSFASNGDCENIKTVPIEHARYLWSKLIKQGWMTPAAFNRDEDLRIAHAMLPIT